MSIKELEQNWDSLGQSDPLWAILYDPARKDNRWTPEEFFATGEQIIDDLMAHISTLEVEFAAPADSPDGGREYGGRGAWSEEEVRVEQATPAVGLGPRRRWGDRAPQASASGGASPLRFGRALDFGCGAGRLTQPLTKYFEHTDGVDIAASMVELARSHNRAGDRCDYHHNTASDLRMFADGSFDFVFTEIVLQHMPPDLMLGYVSEFIRLLAPGGVACFDIPPGYAKTLRGTLTRLAPPPLLKLYRERKHHDSVMELHYIKPREVIAYLEGQGVRLVESRPLPDPEYAVTARHQYLVQRPA